LKEQRLAAKKPENAQELFNLCYSLLRNVVECIFGVLKRQWQILAGKGCEYSIETQVDILQVLVGLYNFGQEHRETDIFADSSVDGSSTIGYKEDEVFQGPSNQWINKKRDNIAEKMWIDY
jgi:hypothetical protein